jgi:phosphopantetheinyl transferase
MEFCLPWVIKKSYIKQQGLQMPDDLTHITADDIKEKHFFASLEKTTAAA